MTPILQSDLIECIAAALQYISFYHPVDYITNLARAYELEAVARRQGRHEADPRQLAHVRRGPSPHLPGHRHRHHLHQARPRVPPRLGRERRARHHVAARHVRRRRAPRLARPRQQAARQSILADPAFSRKNTVDNTPCVVEVSLVEGAKVDVTVAAKGGGSEAKSKFVMLNPSDSVVDWVLKTVPTMGAGWCPPGMLGIGIGGTAEKAMLLAKQALMDPIDMQELKARGPQDQHREAAHRDLRQGQRARHRRAGPRRPHHRARRQDPRLAHPRRQPARRHDPQLRRHPPRALRPRRLRPRLPRPALARSTGRSSPTTSQRRRRVNLDTVTRAEVETWKPGEVLLLNGKLLTGRDAAHKRMTDMLNRGENLPVDFTNRFIYYVGPVDAVRDEAVGPAGPTTATRMDKFTRQMLEADRPARHDRQSRARRRRHRRHPRQPGRLPDGRRRRRLPRLEGHQALRRCSPSRTSAWKPSTSST